MGKSEPGHLQSQAPSDGPAAQDLEDAERSMIGQELPILVGRTVTRTDLLWPGTSAFAGSEIDGVATSTIWASSRRGGEIPAYESPRRTTMICWQLVDAASLAGSRTRERPDSDHADQSSTDCPLAR